MCQIAVSLPLKRKFSFSWLGLRSILRHNDCTIWRLNWVPVSLSRTRIEPLKYYEVLFDLLDIHHGSKLNVTDRKVLLYVLALNPLPLRFVTVDFNLWIPSAKQHKSQHNYFETRITLILFLADVIKALTIAFVLWKTTFVFHIHIKNIRHFAFKRGLKLTNACSADDNAR